MISNRSRIKLCRAVCYVTHPDGQITIRLIKPWDGKPRLPSFPLHIQLAVQTNLYLFADVEESAKLLAAQMAGRDVHAAVFDDILCVRAARMMVADAKANRAAEMQRALVYADWLEPAWVKKLRARIGARER